MNIDYTEISTTSRQNDTKSYMRRRYYDRHNGLYETRNNGRRASRLYEDYNDFDESYRPSCGSRLFESVMLRENLKKIADAFTAQINAEYRDQNIEQYGKDGLYILLLGDLVEKILTMHRRMDKGTDLPAIRFDTEDAQENVFNVVNGKLEGPMGLGDLHSKLTNVNKELANLVIYDLAKTHKEFSAWIVQNFDFVQEGLTVANDDGHNMFKDIIQDAKSNAKTADDLKLYTVNMKDGSTRVFSKSEIKANPKIQQMLVAQLKSQGRWPQKQAASA